MKYTANVITKTVLPALELARISKWRLRGLAVLGVTLVSGSIFGRRNYSVLPVVLLVSLSHAVVRSAA